MPYLKDISALLGLSISTVSKALMDYPDVSDETKRMVLRTAEEINYKHKKRCHDWSEQNGGSERLTGPIGVFVPEIGILLESACYREILCAMAVETACHDRDLVIIGTKMSEQGAELRRREAKGRMIGICILAGESQQSMKEYAELFDSGIPQVIIEQDVSDRPEEIGRAAVRKLIDTAEHSSVNSPLENIE